MLYSKGFVTPLQGNKGAFINCIGSSAVLISKQDVCTINARNGSTTSVTETTDGLDCERKQIHLGLENHVFFLLSNDKFILLFRPIYSFHIQLWPYKITEPNTDFLPITPVVTLIGLAENKNNIDSLERFK